MPAKKKCSPAMNPQCAAASAEIQAHFEAMSQDLKDLKQQMRDILVQTTRTNGRTTNLEEKFAAFMTAHREDRREDGKTLLDLRLSKAHFLGYTAAVSAIVTLALTVFLKFWPK